MPDERPATAIALEALDRAFADVPRPENFTDHAFCEECDEANTLFSGLTPEALLLLPDPPETLPFSFLNTEGFRYFMPAFARMLTLTGEEYCLGDILFHIENRLDTLDDAQLPAFRDVLYAAYAANAAEIEATPFDYEQVWRVLNALDERTP